MNNEDSPNPIRSLVEGISFLSAARAQLTGGADPELRNEARYGVLVPPLPLDHLGLFEAARVDEEKRTENAFLAYELKLAVEALRELLRARAFEGDRTAAPALAHRRAVHA